MSNNAQNDDPPAVPVQQSLNQSPGSPEELQVPVNAATLNTMLAQARHRGRSKSRRSSVQPAERYHQTMMSRSAEAEQLLKLRFAHYRRSASRSASRSQSVDRSQHRRSA